MSFIRRLRDVGTYQWLVILLYTVSCGVNVRTNVSILLTAPRIDHHCDDTSPFFRNLSADQQRTLMSQESMCTRPDVDFSVYTSEELLQMNMTAVNGSRKCDTGFVFDRSQFDYTFTEQFSLVCDRKWLISMAKTVYMLGYFIGAVTSGAVADRFGRRTGAIGAALLTSLFNLLSAWAPTVEVFLLARFLVGSTSISFYTTGVVLCTEIVRKDQRVIPRTVHSIAMSLVMILFIVESMFVRDHRYLQTCIGVELFICVLVMFWFLPESPRWLASQTRHEEAAKIVTHIANFNHWTEARLTHLNAEEEEAEKGREKKANLTDLVRTPVIRKRCILLCTIWFIHVMSYYSLMYNFDTFYTDMRTSIMLSEVVSLGTLCIPVLGATWLGRQFMAFFLLTVSGCCCFGMAPLRETKGTGLLTMAIAAKELLSCQFFINYLFTQELYPTVIRTQGLGVSSTFARLGGMLAPQLVLLDDYWRPASVMIPGVAVIFGALLVPLLPDTTAHELPQSLQDGEQFLNEHKYKLTIAWLVRRRNRDTDEEENLDTDAAGRLPLKTSDDTSMPV